MSQTTLDIRGAFLAVVEALAEEGTAHALIGALPVLARGRVRATTDIDLVVAVTDNWERLSAEAWGIVDRLDPYKVRYGPAS